MVYIIKLMWMIPECIHGNKNSVINLPVKLRVPVCICPPLSSVVAVVVGLSMLLCGTVGLSMLSCRSETRL